MHRVCLVIVLTLSPWLGAAAADRLTEPAITALVAAKKDVMVGRDWTALAAQYLPTAQIVGLYYDRSGVPHVHNGPAGTDVAATAALMTKRTAFAATASVSRIFVSPDGQRATVASTFTAEYEAGGKRVHRVFDDTMILEQTAGQPRIAQDVSIERPPA